MPILGGTTSSQSVTLADRGAWATTTAYSVGDVVTQSATRYVCKTAHTSGTFSTDLAAARWTALDPGAAVRLALAGQTPAEEPLPAGNVTAIGAAGVAADARHVHRRQWGGGASAGIAVGSDIFPVLPFAAANTAFPAGQLRLVPVFIDVDVVLDRIGLFFSTAGSADSLVRFGIYNAKDGVGYPTTVILDTGTTAGNVQDPFLTISQALTAGKYWFAYVCNSATTVPTCFAANAQVTGTIPGVPYTHGTHLQGQSGIFVTGVTGALPNLTSQSWSNSLADANPPFICARVASYTVPA